MAIARSNPALLGSAFSAAEKVDHEFEALELFFIEYIFDLRRHFITLPACHIGSHPLYALSHIRDFRKQFRHLLLMNLAVQICFDRQCAAAVVITLACIQIILHLVIDLRSLGILALCVETVRVMIVQFGRKRAGILGLVDRRKHFPRFIQLIFINQDVCNGHLDRCKRILIIVLSFKLFYNTKGFHRLSVIRKLLRAGCIQRRLDHEVGGNQKRNDDRKNGAFDDNRPCLLSHRDSRFFVPLRRPDRFGSNGRSFKIHSLFRPFRFSVFGLLLRGCCFLHGNNRLCRIRFRMLRRTDYLSS